jgi:polyhydroxyalkanoate synthesis regulator phasin
MEPMMSEDQTGSSKPFDPLDPFRGMRDAYLEAMAKAMVEAVNTEGYAQATGAMLDNSLTISAPVREAMEKSMLQVLQQLALPSRQDIVALAERFTNLEMRLDDIDAKLDRIEKQPHTAQSVAKAEPAWKADTYPRAKPARGAAAKPSAARKSAAAAKQAPRKRAAKKGLR